ncbi:tartrate dehydrogenase, partial [Klebsiella pneumoniae]
PDFLGNGNDPYHTANDGILPAIEQPIACGPKTPDMKGSTSPQKVSEAICKHILA